jgi:UDPglucose 6-dehydrogenase
MRISVIGCGYLGAVHAAAMASLGHDVVGVDVDEEKIRALSAGRPPFFEPGLPELLVEQVASGRLSFTTDIADAAGASVHFIAVGTPQRSDGIGADLRFVDAAVDGLLPIIGPGVVVVGKSTVPVGTAAVLAERIGRSGAALAWNPEFLREGFAIADTLHPDRLVYGVADGSTEVVARLDELYAAPLAEGVPRIVTDLPTAELVKVAANAFLATKISFINAMSEVAEVTGADVAQLADAIGYDARIGRRFLNAGVGFGGGCLPKDIRAFRARADELGVGSSVRFLDEVDQINLRRRARVVDLATELLGGDLSGKRIAVLGLAFKPNSDDIRDSPALDIARRLHAAGADVIATDPEAIESSRRQYPEMTYGSLEQTLDDAELVIVLTEWAQYRDLDPVAARSRVSSPVVIDGRNTLDVDAWRSAGWTYRGLGRHSG